MPPIDFEKTLNAEQLPAVTHGEGPQLVLAGAGSGKTRVITYRVAWLVQERGVDPARIAAVTFTNKAAGEMKDRVEGLLGIYPLPSFVGTFHRFALRLLRAYGGKVGLKREFTILDTSDQLALLKKAMKKEELATDAYRPRSVLAAISSAKNLLLEPVRYEAEADDFYRRTVVAPAYRRYQAFLREAGGVDFDDMIFLAVKLLRENEALKKRLRDRFRYLLVDEFQDTNHAQLELIHEVSDSGGNLTAVGDEDQGIYRWRGAELGNILEFEKSFPGATIRKLERNYRSTQNILDAAGAVVENNVHRRGKRLWTDVGEGEKLLLYQARDEQDEARWTSQVIRGLQGRYSLSDMAVLVRTNAQTRAFEDRFLRDGIGYQLVGGVRFYERAEIKDVIAYLRFARNPHDALSFDRIINRPPRGIGAKTREGLVAQAAEAGKSAWETLEAGGLVGVPARGAKALARFHTQMAPVIEAASDLPLPSLLDRLLDATSYTDLFDPDDEDDRTRLENIDELRSGVQEFTEAHGYGSTEEDLLTAFLDHVSLVSDTDGLRKKPGVTLMTLHSAKGLEYPVVVVAGLEEGVLPHFNAQELPENLEEERRLLYVGMTRAERRLFLTTCRRRRIAGNYQDQEPSRFLLEVPERFLDTETSSELFAAPRPSWNRSRGSSPNRSRPGTSSRPGASRPGMSRPGTSKPGPETARPAAEHVYSFFGKEAPAKQPAGPRQAEQTLPFESSQPASSLTVEPVARPTAAARRLKRGARVRHASLGTGRIMQIEGSGEDMRLIVYFEGKGRKKLLARYAQLEVI
ncbi:MAG: UvrD-helicase domain-containing protein [bacterium]|nr:UvrD-helicase domain-containing protein [bacterium]